MYMDLAPGHLKRSMTPLLLAFVLVVPMVLNAEQRPAPLKTAAPSIPARTQDATGALQKQLVDLKIQVEGLSQAVKKYESWFKYRDALAQMYQEKVDAVIKNSVFLDPSERGYDTITTDTGTFFVSLGKVEPFLDGYRIVLEIGNPYAITFFDLKITIEWNKKIPSDLSNYDAWLKTKRVQDFSDLTELRPGSWTNLPLVLSDTKPDQLGYLQVKLSAKSVRMNR
jgi:hypothetical protein